MLSLLVGVVAVYSFLFGLVRIKVTVASYDILSVDCGLQLLQGLLLLLVVGYWVRELDRWILLELSFVLMR